MQLPTCLGHPYIKVGLFRMGPFKTWIKNGPHNGPIHHLHLSHLPNQLMMPSRKDTKMQYGFGCNPSIVSRII